MKHFSLAAIIILIAWMLSSCSKDSNSNFSEEPIPESPAIPVEPAQNDTVLVSFSLGLDVNVEDLVTTRADGVGDLIGINVTKGESWTDIRYAAGVFDDPSKIVFKLVKGQTYTFRAKYVLNAKAHVYNYPDGSFGMPFRSDRWDTENAWLPNIVYYDATGDTHNAPQLKWLEESTYQTTSNIDTNLRERLNLTSYYGELTVTVGEDTKLEIPMNLCRIGITLNIKNFNEGKIRFTYFGNKQYSFAPGESGHFEMECDGYSFESKSAITPLRVYYDSPDGNSYILGISMFQYEYKKNYVFDFDLKDQMEGAVAITIPTDESLEDESRQLE